MIQRPQSIFLLIVIISLVMAMMLPIWHKQGGEQAYPELEKAYYINAWSLQEISHGKLVKKQSFPYAFVGWGSLVMVGIAAYELFGYKKRGMQIKLGTLNDLAMITLLGCMLWLTRQQEAHLSLEAPGKYRSGFLLFVVALASNLLAVHYIRKDEQLVRESERIR